METRLSNRAKSRPLIGLSPGQRIFCRICLLITFFISFIGTPALASIKAEVLLAQGSQQYLEGNFPEARELLAQAAVLAPQQAGIQLALGQCYLALNEYRKAYWAFRAALYVEPDIKGGRLYLGISQYLLKQYQPAMTTLTQARLQDPEDGLIRYYLGLCALQLNRPKQAIRELAQGYRLSPEFASSFKPYEELASVPTDVRPKKIRQDFLIGFYRDSNADLQTDRFYLSPGRKGGSHIDWAGELGSRTEYYPILKPNFNLGFRLNIFYNHFTWLDVWNFCNARAETFLNFQAGPILLRPVYGIDYTLYAGQEYSTFYIYGLTIGWPETQWLRGELTYRARKKQFHYARGLEYLQHGWDHEIGFYQGLILPGIGVARLGAIFDRDLAKGVFEASRTIGGVLDGVIFLPWNLTGWSKLEVGYREYDNYDIYSQKRRRYKIYRLQLLLKKPLRPDLALWFGYGYVNNKSNIPEWQYGRSIFKLQLTWEVF